MPRSHTCVVDAELPFCEQEITVQIYGTYHPYVPMRGPSYASGGEPPEYASFEYSRIEWFNGQLGVVVDITAMIPVSAEEYVSEAALTAYENGGYGEPDPDAERDAKIEDERLRADMPLVQNRRTAR